MGNEVLCYRTCILNSLCCRHVTYVGLFELLQAYLPIFPITPPPPLSPSSVHILTMSAVSYDDIHITDDSVPNAARRIDIHFPVTPRLSAATTDTRKDLIKEYALTLLENGSAKTNTGETIELYDILRYVVTLTPSIATDNRAINDAAMSLLREILSLMDTMSHGIKGPIPLTEIHALITENVEIVNDFDLGTKTTYLDPNSSRRKYFGGTMATWGSITLDNCVNTLEKWDAYLKWCHDEKAIERIRVRELDDQIRRGMLPTRANGAGARAIHEDLMRNYEARSQFLRYQQEQERNERIAQLMTRVLESHTTPPALANAPLAQLHDAIPSTSVKTARYTGPKLKATINILHWIIVYERICETEGYTSDSERLRLLPKALETDDEAVWSWYSGITTTTDLSWNSITTSLIKTFIPAKDRLPTTLWKNIGSLKKTKTESLLQFSNRFTRALKELDIINSISQVPHEPDFPQLRDTWLKGINDRAIALDVQREARSISDIKTLIKVTLERSEEAEPIRVDTDSTPPTPRANPFASVTPNPLGTTNATTRTYQQGPRFAPRAAPAFNALARPTSSTPPTAAITPTTTDRTKTTPPTKDEDIMKKLTADFQEKLKIQLAGQATKGFNCYRCGEPGHTSRYCTNEPKPQYKGYMLVADTDDGTPHEYDPSFDDDYLRVYHLSLTEEDIIEDLSSDEDFQ